jgi:hypothetical protein
MAINYRNHIQPKVEDAMTLIAEEFIIFLVVVKNGLAETPVILIQLPQTIDDEMRTALKSIAKEIDVNQGYIWFGAKGSPEFASDQPSNKYVERLRSGMGIEVEDGECGTAGLFLSHEDGEKTLITGITAGHVVKRKPHGRAIYQPTIKGFMREYTILAKKIQELKSRPVPRSPKGKQIRQREIENLEAEHNALRIIKGDNIADTKRNLTVGTAVNAEFKAVDFDGRHCVSDWGTVEIMAREPQEQVWGAEPTLEGYLQSLEWKATDGAIIPLTYDLCVRKTGGSSGLRFGFVAGVTSSFKSKKIQTKEILHEYYCFQEEREEENRFARAGDSGSAVITNDGKITGFVYASSTIDDVMLIIDHETGELDIKEFAKQRRSDGFVDIDRVWARTFNGTEFVLVESAMMLMERSGVKGEVVLDC